MHWLVMQLERTTPDRLPPARASSAAWSAPLGLASVCTKTVAPCRRACAPSLIWPPPPAPPGACCSQLWLPSCVSRPAACPSAANWPPASAFAHCRLPGLPAASSEASAAPLPLPSMVLGWRSQRRMSALCPPAHAERPSIGVLAAHRGLFATPCDAARTCTPLPCQSGEPHCL